MTSFSLWARRSPAIRVLAQPFTRFRQRISSPGHRYQLELWERLQSLLVEDPVVEVAEFGGAFQLDPRSHVLKRLLLEGVYEPAISRLCQQLADPTRDAVDVGANAGFFSVLLAKQLPKQRVLAVEPSPKMASRLRANLDRNGVGDRVLLFEGALSNHAGTVALTGVAGNEEYGTIGTFAHPAAQRLAQAPGTRMTVQEVASESLDALVERHDLALGLIKIDVEGAEAMVLQGARRVLAEHRPVLVSELDDRMLRANGSSAMDVVRFLQGEGYRVLHPTADGHPPVTREQLETPHVLDTVLCVPDEVALTTR